MQEENEVSLVNLELLQHGQALVATFSSGLPLLVILLLLLLLLLLLAPPAPPSRLHPTHPKLNPSL